MIARHGSDKGVGKLMKKHGTINFAVGHHIYGDAEFAIEYGSDPFGARADTLILRRFIKHQMHLVFGTKVEQVTKGVIGHL